MRRSVGNLHNVNHLITTTVIGLTRAVPPQAVNVANILECCETCHRTVECKAFTFADSGVCYLKYSAGGIEPNMALVSGTIKAVVAAAS
jgi:collagenase-like PrtC family protease